MSSLPILDKYIVSLATEHHCDFEMIVQKLEILTGIPNGVLKPHLIAQRYYQLKGNGKLPLLEYGLTFPSSFICDDDTDEEFYIVPDRYKAIPDFEPGDDDHINAKPCIDPYVRSHKQRSHEESSIDVPEEEEPMAPGAASEGTVVGLRYITVQDSSEE